MMPQSKEDQLIEELSEIIDHRARRAIVVALTIKVANLRGEDVTSEPYRVLEDNLLEDAATREQENGHNVVWKVLKAEAEMIRKRRERFKDAALTAVVVTVIGGIGGAGLRGYQCRDRELEPISLHDGAIARMVMVDPDGLLGINVSTVFEERHCDSTETRARIAYGVGEDGATVGLGISDHFSEPSYSEWSDWDAGEAWDRFIWDDKGLRFAGALEERGIEIGANSRDIHRFPVRLQGDLGELAETWLTDLPESACKY
jgi:hypothetical protein